MRLLCLTAMISAAMFTAVAQVQSNTLTIGASRPFALSPDQAIISVYVRSGSAVGADAVFAAVAPVGLSPANLQYVQSTRDPDSNMSLDWTFSLPVSFPKVKSTLDALRFIQQALTRDTGAISLTFSLTGARSSPEQQPQCPYQDLLSDAQAESEKLADAAQLRAGPIVSLSDARGAPTLAAYNIVAVPAALLDFGPPVRTCTLVVEFQLLH